MERPSIPWIPKLGGRSKAMAYYQSKKDQHRFDGQGKVGTIRAPIYDLIERKEIIT